jgi:hypothetical protein
MGPGIIRPLRLARRRRAGWALAAAAFAQGVLPAPASAQEIATARMAATIDTPISIVNGADMDFGKIAYTAAGGTVVLSPGATATCTPSAGLVHIGICQAAKFEGEVSWLFTLRVQRPNGDRITLTGPAGATMRLDNFTFGAGAGVWDLGPNGANHRFLIVNFDGSYTFYTGGTLHVAANQAPGVYTGTFEIQLNYN